MNKHNFTVEKLLEVIDRKELEVRYGFTKQDVSRAKIKGQFSAKWFPYVRSLCVDVGVDVPEYLFCWSTVPDKIHWPSNIVIIEGIA